MREQGGKIWIDLENSPHVPFFKPIIDVLEQRGYAVLLTARDCFQVCGLADLYRLSYRKIGHHYGKNKIMKVVGLLVRSMQMIPVASREKPVLAISHGSRTQLVAAKVLRITAMQMLDYEFTKKLPAFLHADRILMPEMIPADRHWRDISRISTYPGIKEDVYVPAFSPEPGILRELDISGDDLLVTIRPPASEAHYHNPESDALFRATVDWLAGIANLSMVVLPRNENQGAIIRETWPGLLGERKIIIPDKVVDGLNLLWFSDLVISGGGTMNREAAALGVPVYSIFRGEIGAVDRYLAGQGRLTLLETPEDIKTKVALVKWARPVAPDRGNRPALNAIVEEVVSLLDSDRGRNGRQAAKGAGLARR